MTTGPASNPAASAASSMPYPPGTILAGKYRVERLLGEGGMGWVVVATHLHLEQRVAIKFMRAGQATESPDAVGRFLREARAAARIQSEHVARVADFGTLENGAPYLVMEYLEGQDLDGLLQAGPMPLALAIDYAMQACEGLSEAHAAGIVHRDLKPANLFLAKRTDGSIRVKLLDFGISKLAPVAGGSASGSVTSTQALMGSPLYMAPEQMRSSKSVDHRADIWSMGIILHEMLSGSSPFSGETLPEVCARIMTDAPTSLREARPEVSLALEAVVLRCLEKDVQKRFQDVAALAQALAPLASAPETRSTAERIGRVVRGAQPSLAEIPASPDAFAATTNSPERPFAIAQTSAAFGTTGPTPGLRRSRALPIGGAVAALVAVAAIVVATRGKTPADGAPPATGPSGVATASSGLPPPALTAAAPATPETLTPRTAETLVTAPAAPTAPAPTASHAASPASPAPVVPGHAKPKAASAAPTVPTLPAAPAAPVKPAATSAFGGRD